MTETKVLCPGCGSQWVSHNADSSYTCLRCGHKWFRVGLPGKK